MASPRFQLQSPRDLQARMDAERSGAPFLVFRDGGGRQHIVGLLADDERIALGRVPEDGIALAWDPEVSRVHAVLEHVAGAWFVVDDGISRNGTFVNEVRVSTRRRLSDGDMVRCGSVVLEFHDPRRRAEAPTLKAKEEAKPATRLSPGQLRVLVALCRPLANNPHGVPATNKEIAAELVLSLDTVKSQLRRAAEVFGVDGLPQNEKRTRLAWAAIESGAIAPHDLVARD